MNWLDIVLVCLAIVGFIKGWLDGFVRQAVTFIALIAAIYLCSEGAEFLRGYVLQTGWFPEYSVSTASHILAFLLIGGVILLAGGMIHRMINLTPLSLLNHLAGGVCGWLMTAVFLSLTLNMLDGVDRQSKLIPQATKVESRLYFHVREFVPVIYPVDLFIWRK
jgi:membrane protein required for colicin V production